MNAVTILIFVLIFGLGCAGIYHDNISIFIAVVVATTAAIINVIEDENEVIIKITFWILMLSLLYGALSFVQMHFKVNIPFIY